MVRILTLKERCAQHFCLFLVRCRALGTFDSDSCQVLLLIYEQRFCKAAFRPVIFLFVASIMTIIAIFVVQPPLSPTTGNKWRPVSKSQFLLWRSQESKSTVDILLRGWNAYGSSADSPKKMTLVRISASLLIYARLHVSFCFPFLFSFPFTLYRKLEKIHSFLQP